MRRANSSSRLVLLVVCVSVFVIVIKCKNNPICPKCEGREVRKRKKERRNVRKEYDNY